MIAIPFVPIAEKTPAYNILRGLNEMETENVIRLLGIVAEEEEMHKTLPKNTIDFFKEIMYPFKKSIDYNASAKFKVVPYDILSISAIHDGMVIRPSEDPMSNRRFFSSKRPIDSDPRPMVVNSPLYPVVASILNGYLLYLHALRGFAETYPDVSAMQKLNMYWKLCNNAKI